MENVLTPTLEQTLAQVIQQLANFFGTTTTAIIDNMPDFLTMYAWYYTFNNLWYIPCVVLLSVFASVFLFLFWEDCIDFEVKVSDFMKTGVKVGLLICAFIFIKDIALCFICPEIVGGMALLEKIGYLTK